MDMLVVYSDSIEGEFTHPDGNSLALVNFSALHRVITGGDDIRQVESLLVGNVIRDLEKVGVCERHADLLGLTTSVTTSKI